MRTGVVVGIVAVVALSAAAGVGAQGAHKTSVQLKSDLQAVGYKEVKPDGLAYTTSKYTATLHGCTVGFQSTKGEPRKVSKTVTIHHYVVNSVANGAWVVVADLKDKTPTPAEMDQYMKAHGKEFPCYGRGH